MYDWALRYVSVLKSNCECWKSMDRVESGGNVESRRTSGLRDLIAWWKGWNNCNVKKYVSERIGKMVLNVNAHFRTVDESFEMHVKCSGDQTNPWKCHHCRINHPSPKKNSIVAFCTYEIKIGIQPCKTVLEKNLHSYNLWDTEVQAKGTDDSGFCSAVYLIL